MLFVAGLEAYLALHRAQLVYVLYSITSPLLGIETTARLGWLGRPLWALNDTATTSRKMLLLRECHRANGMVPRFWGSLLCMQSSKPNQEIAWVSAPSNCALQCC